VRIINVKIKNQNVKLWSRFVTIFMNILTIDFGTKRIGLAWTNTEVGVVLPFGQIKEQKAKSKEQILVELIDREKIDKVIIGMPLGLDGEDNPNTERVKKFANELRNATTVSVELFDERFSSGQADAMGGRATRDEKAAMVILQGYLDKQKNII